MPLMLVILFGLSAFALAVSSACNALPSDDFPGLPLTSRFCLQVTSLKAFSDYLILKQLCLTLSFPLTGLFLLQ